MTALPLVATEETMVTEGTMATEETMVTKGTMVMEGTVVMEETVVTEGTVVMGTVQRAVAVGATAKMETVTMTTGLRSPNTVA